MSQVDLEALRGKIRLARADASAAETANHIRTGEPPPGFYNPNQLEGYRTVRGLVLNAAADATREAGIETHRVIPRFDTRFTDHMRFLVVLDREEVDPKPSTIEPNRGFFLQFDHRRSWVDGSRPNLGLFHHDWLTPWGRSETLKDPGEAFSLAQSPNASFGYISIRLHELTQPKVTDLVRVGLAHPDLLRNP